VMGGGTYSRGIDVVLLISFISELI
jgi:hypothetical protein